MRGWGVKGDRKVRDKPRFKLAGINNSDGDLSV